MKGMRGGERRGRRAAAGAERGSRPPAEAAPLAREFFERPPLEVAPALLGKLLLRRWRGIWLAGRIVEVEAYLGREDPAAHAWRGPTPRNRVLFGPAGHAYVYLIYGLHTCLNVSTLPAGEAGCVLLRALQPAMAGAAGPGGETTPKTMSGPGRLTRVLHIGRALNGRDLTQAGDLYLADDGWPARLAEAERREWSEIRVTRRIGISRARELPARFYLAASRAVSGPRQ